MTITEIVNSIYKDTDTNATSFTAANMLLDINDAYQHAVSLIYQTDGRFQFDDDNQTDEPMAMYTLTSGTQNYTIATSITSLSRVEVKDSNGNWSTLTPFDGSDVGDNLSQFMTGGGIPTAYRKVGNDIYLYPTPNYTLSNALKFYFKRTPILFTSAEVTTGTKVPGFNALYHEFIPLRVSYRHCRDKNKPNAERLKRDLQEVTDAMQDFYRMRTPDEPLRMRARNTRIR